VSRARRRYGLLRARAVLPSFPRKSAPRLPAFLDKGAEHFGFRGEVWTRRRVGAVIEEVFGVSYSDSHVGRILRQIGWSLQKPAERASGRDEEQIENWKEKKWPRIKNIKKSPRGEQNRDFRRRSRFLPSARRGQDVGAKRRNAGFESASALESSFGDRRSLGGR
jgi:transposase